jgi:hypothetical protein
VPLGAPRVAVDLLDQRGDGPAAVADDLRRLAARGGDDPVADDQQAVVVARGEPLDQDCSTPPASPLVGGQDLLAGPSGRWRRRGPGCRPAA